MAAGARLFPGHHPERAVRVLGVAAFFHSNIARSSLSSAYAVLRDNGIRYAFDCKLFCFIASS
jgi:hypothetical protein